LDSKLIIKLQILRHLVALHGREIGPSQELAPWSRVLSDKSVMAQLSMKLCDTRRSLIVVVQGPIKALPLFSHSFAEVLCLLPDPLVHYRVHKSRPSLRQMNCVHILTRCCFKIYFNVGFEVLTAMVMKMSILCDITPCSPLKINPGFRGTCRLYLQGRGISQTRNQHEAGSKQSRGTLRSPKA
jgi:hypothetical protein